MVKFVIQGDNPDGWVGNRLEGRWGLKLLIQPRQRWGRRNSNAAGIQVVPSATQAVLQYPYVLFPQTAGMSSLRTCLQWWTGSASTASLAHLMKASKAGRVLPQCPILDANQGTTQNINIHLIGR